MDGLGLDVYDFFIMDDCFNDKNIPNQCKIKMCKTGID